MTKSNKRMLFLCVMLLGIFPFFWTEASVADIIIKPPLSPIFQGDPLPIIVEITEIKIEKGDLFFRPIGIRYYQRLPIDLRKKGPNVINIPPTAVVAPGIEYYIKLVDIEKKAITSPQSYASSDPHTIKVSESTPSPELKLISPDTRVPFHGETLSVIIEIDSPSITLSNNNVTIILDETDITALSAFARDRLTFSTSLVPEAGDHTLMVKITDRTGKTHEKSWNFQVADRKDKEKTREFYARGGISFNYGIQLKNPDGSNSDPMSGNINLEFGVKGDDWEATWNGINVQYIKDNPGDDLTLSSGFYFTLTKGDQFLEYGDITINETPLTAPSFARRGLQAKLKGLENELHLFNVSTNTVSGWKSGIGESDGQVYGVSIKRSLLPDNRLPFTLAYITGENETVSGFNTASNEKPSKGDVLGFTLDHTFSGIAIKSEVAGSQYDKDTTDNLEKKDDIAGTAGLSTNLGKVSLGTNYFYYGPNFVSIANPNFTADREGLSANVSRSFGPSNISVNGSRAWDNVREDPSRPIVYSTSGTVSYGIALAPWPSMNLSYSRSLQDSRKEPVGSQEVKNTNDTVNMGLSMSGEIWNANLSGNYGRLEDKIGSLGSLTRGFQLSGNYTPYKGLSLNPSAGFTESRTSGVLKDTFIASLSASVPLWSPYADTSLQVSNTINDASDRSINSSNLNGSWRLSVNLHEFLKNWIGYEGQQMLALSLDYNRIKDKVTPSNSGEDISVFLSLNLFSLYTPIEWGMGF